MLLITTWFPKVKDYMCISSDTNAPDARKIIPEQVWILL